jgi:hypothetical protein
MRLVTTTGLALLDASQPKDRSGFHQKKHVGAGSYDMDEIPNPSPKPEHLDPQYWSATWLVIRGTRVGLSRYAFEHDYSGRDQSTRLI